MDPINYGGITLKNRIIFAPTTMGLKMEEYLQKLEDIAEGGCAMMVIGDVPVRKSHFAPSLWNQKGMEHYRKITDTIHAHDCMVCSQLHQSDSNFSGMIKYIPGILTGKISKMEMRSLLNQEVSSYISSMPADKVKDITASFGTAAEKAAEAGFDLIQVHGDRMCGSFSSSLTNKRTDEYGGPVKNRARFAAESIRAIREKLPDIPIDYKLVIRMEEPHYGTAGILMEEIPEFISVIEREGITSYHVALANHGKLEDTIPDARHPEFSGQGCFLRFCDELRKYTDLPICGVGGLSDPDYIEEQLETGRIDCAAMSRQLIADPEWVRKVSHGHTAAIQKCIRCNKKCLGGMYEHKGVHCIYE